MLWIFGLKGFLLQKILIGVSYDSVDVGSAQDGWDKIVVVGHPGANVNGAVIIFVVGVDI